ncbi:MAG: hypothetical protein M3N21_09135 [Actinomycetota bacterium]|nr:hypothetical protein [Actinomycetota bacterium]
MVSIETTDGPVSAVSQALADAVAAMLLPTRGTQQDLLVAMDRNLLDTESGDESTAAA